MKPARKINGKNKMKITKTTTKYEFYKEGNDYILNLGKIKKGEDTTTELLFEEVDAVKLKVTATCGCTVADRTEVNNTTVRVSVKYKNCDPSFSKILNCYNNKENFKIKIKGKCQ